MCGLAIRSRDPLLVDSACICITHRTAACRAQYTASPQHLVPHLKRQRRLGGFTSQQKSMDQAGSGRLPWRRKEMKTGGASAVLRALTDKKRGFRIWLSTRLPLFFCVACSGLLLLVKGDRAAGRPRCALSDATLFLICALRALDADFGIARYRGMVLADCSWGHAELSPM